MDKQVPHRYQIWTASSERAPLPAPAQAPLRSGSPSARKPVATSVRPMKGRDDLDTSMLIYGYGLPIALDGVCTLPSGLSAKCQTTKISSDSVNVLYAPSPPGMPKPKREMMTKGASVNLRLDEVGALRGTLKAQDQEGFEVAVDHAYQTVLGAKLSHLAAKRGIKPAAAPVAPIPIETRIEPVSKDCWFLDQTGTLRKALIVNLSQIDALLRATIIPPVGARIVFRGPRRYAAEVTSIFKIGFMVKFCDQLPVQEFTTAIKFSDV